MIDCQMQVYVAVHAPAFCISLASSAERGKRPAPQRTPGEIQPDRKERKQ